VFARRGGFCCARLAETSFLHAHQTLLAGHYAGSFMGAFPRQLRRLDDNTESSGCWLGFCEEAVDCVCEARGFLLREASSTRSFTSPTRQNNKIQHALPSAASLAQQKPPRLANTINPGEVGLED
jgi:hypothetical protein